MRLSSFYAIGIFHERLEIALCRRGRVVAAVRRPIALPSQGDAEAWAEELRGAAPTLREMVNDLTRPSSTQPVESSTSQTPRQDSGRRSSLRSWLSREAPAFVFYESPSAVADCFSFPLSAAGEAREAALLSVSDAVSEPMEHVRAGALVLERDSEGRRDSKSNGSAATPRRKRTHVVAAAESEDTLLAIESLLGRAGLQLIGAAPIHAVIAACALRSCDGPPPELTAFRTVVASAASLLDPDLSRKPTKQTNDVCPATDRDLVARLHIAECGAFLLIRGAAAQREGRSRGEGPLRFTRSIGIGTNAMAASLMRSSNAEATSTGRIKLGESSNERDQLRERELAQQALYEFGVPTSPAAVHAPSGLTGREILASLQPLLQRLIVELRQSLRFALDPDERTRVKIVISGPGAAVPGLAAALAQELQLSVAAGDARQLQSESARLADSPPSDLRTAARTWINHSRKFAELALLPRSLAQRFLMARLRRALWAGAAAALLMIALDSARLSATLRTPGAAAAPPTPTSHTADTARDAELLATVETGRRLRARVDRETLLNVDARAALHELSRLTPDSIRFTNINLQSAAARDGKSPRTTRLTITGVASLASAGPIRSDIEQFVHGLRATPLFEDVTLANVFAVAERDSRAQRFEIRCVAVHAPLRMVAHEPAPGSNAPRGGQP